MVKVVKYKFKKNPDLHSEDFFYDLAYGGYLSAKDFSDDKKTIEAINDAIDLLKILQERVDSVMNERMDEQE